MKKPYTSPTVTELGNMAELTATEIKCNGSADINDLIPPEDTRPPIVVVPGDPQPSDCA